MQGTRLYVGNLTYSVTSDQLKELFADFGEVKDVDIIEGKGFGFVEFASTEDAERAKEELNGVEYSGRTLRVDEARPRRENTRGGGGGGGGYRDR